MTLYERIETAIPEAVTWTMVSANTSQTFRAGCGWADALKMSLSEKKIIPTFTVRSSSLIYEQTVDDNTARADVYLMNRLWCLTDV
jgi:hypothetical protein